MKKTVKQDVNDQVVHNAIVQQAASGRVRLLNVGSSISYEVPVPTHIDFSKIEKDDRALVVVDKGQTHLVSVYKRSSGSPPIRSSAVISNELNSTDVGAGSNIEVLENVGGGVLVALANNVEFDRGSIGNADLVRFWNGGGFQSADDDHIALIGKAMISELTALDRGWTLGNDGSWRMMRRESLVAGPDLSDTFFTWYSSAGAPWVDMANDYVSMGLPGSENNLTIDPDNGLKIHGSAITVETLDAMSIGPNLTQRISELAAAKPIYLSGDGNVSPWSLDSAPRSPVVVTISDSINLWVKGGHLSWYPNDTRLLHIGADGFSYGGVTMNQYGYVSIPADLLVGGQLRVGERIELGTGYWGFDFAGLAISSNYGIVGLRSSDWFDADPARGTYQVWFNSNDGSLRAAAGDVIIDGGGMRFYTPPYGLYAYAPGLPEHKRTSLVWGNDDTGYDVTLTSFLGYATFAAGLGWENKITMKVGEGIKLYTGNTGDDVVVDVHAGSAFRVLIDGRQAWAVTGSGEITAPFQVVGGSHTTLFDERGWIGVNTQSPQASIHIATGDAAVRVGQDNYVEYGWDGIHASDSLVLQASSLLPLYAVTTDLGSPTQKFRNIYAHELHIDTIAAQNVMATIGGRIVVAPTDQLAVDLQTSDTTIYLKSSAHASGDHFFMQSRGNFEALKFTSGGTITGDGWYSYTIDRNLDGGGANQWFAGDAILNTRQTGKGFIDAYADSSVFSASALGPAIAFNVRTANTNWNDVKNRTVVGRLSGTYGYSSAEVWGLAAGDPGGINLTVDETSGIRFRNVSDVLVSLDSTALVLGASAREHVRIESGSISLKKGTDEIIVLSTVGSIKVNPNAGGSIAIGSGWTALPTGTDSIALGVKAGSGATGNDSIYIGFQAGFGSSGRDPIAIGTSAGYSGSGHDAITIGIMSGLANTADRLVAMGTRAGFGNTGADVVALGANAGDGNTFADVIVIGSGAVATATNQMVIGSSDHEYNEFYGGGGVVQATPPTFTINATGGSGTNVAGAALKLAGGIGTGTGTGGAVTIQTAPAGSTGDTPNSLVDRITVTSTGVTNIGDGGTTNYASFAADGTLSLYGTARYERHVQLDAKTDGTVGNQPTAVDFYTAGGLQYPATGSKFAFAQWEIPDDWDGGDVYFEVDWFPDSAAISGTAAVRWTVEYRSIAEGELISNGTSVTLDNGVGGDTSDYSQYQTKHTRFTLAYNNANQPLTVQDHVYFKISRDTGVTNDFSGSVTVMAYEIIYNSTGFPTSN